MCHMNDGSKIFHYYRNMVIEEGIYNNPEYDQIIKMFIYLKYIISYHGGFASPTKTKRLYIKGKRLSST